MRGLSISKPPGRRSVTRTREGQELSSLTDSTATKRSFCAASVTLASLPSSR
jgi:hypothetical protein